MTGRAISKVIVIGLDGLEPTIVEPMVERGELPALARLRSVGGYSRVRTTYPAQTPVAWSTFATGTNPGGHGIYDFVRRDPRTYFPDFSLNRYEQKNAFLPPRAVNLRRGTPFWELLTAAGVPSTIIRCPCTFPPDELKGRMLSGMGVPDLRGGLGTSTFYTSADAVRAGESEQVIRVEPRGDTVRTHLIGPRHPRTRADILHEITVRLEPAARRVTILTDGEPRELRVDVGAWSAWARVKFKTGLLQGVHGMVRFHLVRLEPHLELYASPVNFDPESTLLYPISAPADYARELSKAVGTFYTTGMVEDHGGLTNGRFDEAAYLAQCDDVLRERERMLQHELARHREGVLFCLFDTPDRVQHMFWRFREDDHPANRDGVDRGLERVIEDHYRACDDIVGRALAQADDRTLFVVLSDHGFSSFQRGFHINTWLHDQGLLALKPGVVPGEEAGEFFRAVDWSRTQAYALGIGSVYLNVKGREAQGVVDPSEAERLAGRIARALTGVCDPERGRVAVRGAATRAQLYSGAHAQDSPDLVVLFEAGYRASWTTALGGVPRGHFEDNVKKWGGDHIVDPGLVPGVLFMNRPFRGESVGLADLAPTILGALGVPKGPAMEGESLLP
ncbi:MAG TPA: alkaline phosphatase family protein [Gemmatimonadales bacterium]|nr:alkaline phosphatase family protein [Gemmatimonadales bacterium]